VHEFSDIVCSLHLISALEFVRDTSILFGSEFVSQTSM